MYICVINLLLNLVVIFFLRLVIVFFCFSFLFRLCRLWSMWRFLGVLFLVWCLGMIRFLFVDCGFFWSWIEFFFGICRLLVFELIGVGFLFSLIGVVLKVWLNGFVLFVLGMGVVIISGLFIWVIFLFWLFV